MPECVMPIGDYDLCEVRAALRHGATALRCLAREASFDNNRFVVLDARDRVARIAHAHYTNLRRSAEILTALADELALAPADIVTPDEDHP